MSIGNVRAYPLTGLEPEQTAELSQYPILACGAGLPDENTLYAFDTDEGFERWISGTPHADHVRRVKGEIAAAKRLEHADNAFEIEKQRVLSERFIKDLHDLSLSTGLPANSVELLRKVVAERNPLRGSNPLFLYEHINFGGSIYPVWGWSGSFSSWWGSNFHQRASSCIAIDAVVGIICERSWWGGRWLWFFGPVWWSSNLHSLGFGDIASSAWMSPG